jgi:uncharacterized protein (DUF305 family)
MKNQLKIILSTGLCCLGIFTLSPLLLERMTFLQAQVTSSPQTSLSSLGMGKMGMMNDQHFIVMMIPHHESAIAMADLALTRAQHSEIKQLAQNIKLSQSKEIEQMRAWYKTWYGTFVPKLNSNSTGGGMHGGNMGMMTNMDTDLTALRNAKNFDQVFIEEMIPHHQMAVTMAKDLIPNSKHPEMKKLAQAIIQAQNKEIQQMQAWYQQWYPTKSK